MDTDRKKVLMNGCREFLFSFLQRVRKLPCQPARSSVIHHRYFFGVHYDVISLALRLMFSQKKGNSTVSLADIRKLRHSCLWGEV